MTTAEVVTADEDGTTGTALEVTAGDVVVAAAADMSAFVPCRHVDRSLTYKSEQLKKELLSA